MPLVHESLIGILNRRFANFYFNAFPGPCYDAEAHALKRALADHPEYDRMSAEESARIERAAAHPQDPGLQIEAARLLSELLRFDEARAVLDRVDLARLAPRQAARVHYWKGHLTRIDLDGTDAAAVRREFDAMEDPPPDLADDVALDRMSLDLVLDRSQSFFGGWHFREGCYLPSRAAELERWIARAPDSNRIGQMEFLLGAARMGMGDQAGADAAWKEGFTRCPKDRWAMLSRMHHTSYVFSPYGKNKVSGGTIADPRTQAQLQQLLEKGEGGSFKVFMNGKELEGDEARAALEKLLGGDPPAGKKKPGKEKRRF